MLGIFYCLMLAGSVVMMLAVSWDKPAIVAIFTLPALVCAAMLTISISDAYHGRKDSA